MTFLFASAALISSPSLRLGLPSLTTSTGFASLKSGQPSFFQVFQNSSLWRMCLMFAANPRPSGGVSSKSLYTSDMVFLTQVDCSSVKTCDSCLKRTVDCRYWMRMRNCTRT
uniref:Putative secreted protein n=1 Tax=Ixodes ricinus TaxID=34613 RepID=A0A6B0UK09_IXORI